MPETFWWWNRSDLAGFMWSQKGGPFWNRWRLCSPDLLCDWLKVKGLLKSTDQSSLLTIYLTHTHIQSNSFLNTLGIFSCSLIHTHTPHKDMHIIGGEPLGFSAGTSFLLDKVLSTFSISLVGLSVLGSIRSSCVVHLAWCYLCIFKLC